MKGLVLSFCSLFFLAVKVFRKNNWLFLKNGHLRASFKEGELSSFCIKEGSSPCEGHIVELNSFSMITSNDTVQFKDIMKIDIRKHRGPARIAMVSGDFFF